MDKYNFLDHKSIEIGKLCLKSWNEVKLASFTLPLTVYICLWRALKNKIYTIFNEKEKFPIVNLPNYLVKFLEIVKGFNCPYQNEPEISYQPYMVS